MHDVIPLRSTPLKSGVEFVRPELLDVLPRYVLVNDVINGSDAVKARTTRYLPMPNPSDKSRENRDRYDSYLMRATFHPVTSRTLAGFLGALFMVTPEIRVPRSMEDIIEDMNGESIGAVQLAKIATTYVLAHGRAGAYVDFPETGGAVTADQLQNARPVIHVVQSDQVINWRYRRIGSLSKLELVVIKEQYDHYTDEYKVERRWQYRVMRLNAQGEATVEFYRTELGKQMVNASGIPVDAPIMLRDGTGMPLDEIPFMFIGAQTNNAAIDPSPLYEMAELNLAHYRNSADFEQSVHIVGQPTLVVTGVDQSWADRFYKDGFALGSNAAIALPVGGTADLMQAAEGNMIKEAMELKERQMISIGAKLIEQREVQRTAFEAKLENAGENSVLGTIADNVSVAFEWALYFAARFMGLTDTGIIFRLNKEFLNSFATPEARQEVVTAWQAGAISWSEMRAALRKGGIATLEDEKAKAEIQQDREAEISAMGEIGGFEAGDTDDTGENGAEVSQVNE